jgi:thiamine biosynthesis lipoprotein
MPKEPQMKQDDTLSPGSSNFIGDVVRYAVILTVVGVGIWFYLQKPLTYAAQEARGMTMGTDYSVKITHFPKNNDPNAWKKFAQLIQQRLDDIDHAMSTYRDDSEISRFNVSDSTEWFGVSEKTAKVVQLSLEISKLSNGTFDITVGPLVDLWGFGPGHSEWTAKEIEEKTIEIKSRIGYDKLEVQIVPPALKKLIPELRIDLSAIAKGYAVDCVAELLEENHFVDYMVEVGGEVRCRGHKGEAKNWIVGIEKPFIDLQGGFPGLQRKLHLGDRALATSGDYQNFRELDGKKYSHIIDPRTGFPTEQLADGEPEPTERLGSVSVLAETCARADALATAMFVLGEHKGLELAEKQGIAVLFLLRTGHKDDPIREAASTAFPKTSLP